MLPAAPSSARQGPGPEGRRPERLAPASAVVAAGGPVILLLGALVPEQRPLAFAALVAGWAVLRLARRPEAIAWAACLPVATAFLWPAVLGADQPVGDPACTDPLGVIAVRRVALAVAVAGVVAALAIAHHADLGSLGLRRPARGEVAVAVAGCLALAAGGLVVGPLVARPFFGALAFPVPAAALVPGLVFGVANGVTEELQYRGAMQGWLGWVVPRWVAIALPALAFGIVHAGPEVIALLPLHVALLTGVGLAAGGVRAWTGTLAIPIGIHVGADIALYVGLACRAPA